MQRALLKNTYNVITNQCSVVNTDDEDNTKEILPFFELKSFIGPQPSASDHFHGVMIDNGQENVSTGGPQQYLAYCRYVGVPE